MWIYAISQTCQGFTSSFAAYFKIVICEERLLFKLFFKKYLTILFQKIKKKTDSSRWVTDFAKTRMFLDHFFSLLLTLEQHSCPNT